jgi:hypothetical protein
VLRKYRILLSLVAFSLVLSPCAEAVVVVVEKHVSHNGLSCCSKKEKSSCCTAASEHCEQDADDDAHGNCSSLCHCSCCGHVSGIFYVELPLIYYTVLPTPETNYAGPVIEEYTFSVWQPPRG